MESINTLHWDLEVSLANNISYLIRKAHIQYFISILKRLWYLRSKHNYFKKFVLSTRRVLTLLKLGQKKDEVLLGEKDIGG